MRRAARVAWLGRTCPWLAPGAMAMGCTAHAQIADLMHDSWQIVREYEQAGYTYYLVQEGPRYAKMVQIPSGPVYTVYGVDTFTQTCKGEDVVIDCARLRDEPDLGPYVTWTAPAPSPSPEPPVVLPPAPTGPGPTTPDPTVVW